MNIITTTIKGAMKRNNINGRLLSRITGIRYGTLQYRWRNPSTWNFGEWAALQNNIDFLPDELNLIGKEVKKL